MAKRGEAGPGSKSAGGLWKGLRRAAGECVVCFLRWKGSGREKAHTTGGQQGMGRQEEIRCGGQKEEEGVRCIRAAASKTGRVSPPPKKRERGGEAEEGEEKGRGERRVNRGGWRETSPPHCCAGAVLRSKRGVLRSKKEVWGGTKKCGAGKKTKRRPFDGWARRGERGSPRCGRRR